MGQQNKLNYLKDNLENFELYLDEIEHNLSIISNTNDSSIHEKCFMCIAQLQQRIYTMSDNMEKTLSIKIQ